MNYAGFGKRFLAYLIDWILIGVCQWIFILLFGYYAYYFGGFLVSALYFILFEGSGWHATLGKKALGIMVVDLNGNGITYGTAVIRYLGKILSSITLFIGYLMAAFTQNCQALHDKIANTYVVEAAPASMNYNSGPRPGPAPGPSPSYVSGRQIVGISGEFAGRSVQLAPTGTIIGRDPVACQIALSASSPGVSRHHCQVDFNPQTGMFIVNDLGSTYGTYLMNGTKLTSGQPAALRPGERFCVGSQANIFEVR